MFGGGHYSKIEAVFNKMYKDTISTFGKTKTTLNRANLASVISPNLGAETGYDINVNAIINRVR